MHQPQIPRQWPLARLGGLAAGLLLAASASFAAPTGYTSRAAFDGALGGFAATTENFDALPSGTVIANGGAAGAITFGYDFGAVQMAVTDGTAFGGGVSPYNTVSAPNFLGTADGEMFQDGDDFSMHFAAANAIGLYLLSADPLFDGDFRLSAFGIAVTLLASAVQWQFDDGTNAYFLGIVDPDFSAGTATLSTSYDGQVGNFLWNADDIVTALPRNNVPEPGSLALAALALAALGTRKYQFNQRRIPC